jgi:hypothetical protein
MGFEVGLGRSQPWKQQEKSQQTNDYYLLMISVVII